MIESDFSVLCVLGRTPAGIENVIAIQQNFVVSGHANSVNDHQVCHLSVSLLLGFMRYRGILSVCVTGHEGENPRI
jgi:hypothetical protein